MPILTLKLFGQPEVKIAGEAVAGFHSKKARALLFYLAVTSHPQARTVLASLFWGKFPDDRAMSNLRKTLSNLNQLVGSYLTIERNQVAFDRTAEWWSDVKAFEAELSKLDTGEGLESAERAAAIYQGDFLEGFYIDEAPEWENWVLLERQRLQEGYYKALLGLANFHSEKGDYERAIGFAQKLVAEEPWREDGQRLLIGLYAQNGQRGRAVRQYDAFRQVLAEELDISPTPETEILIEGIRSGETGSAEKTLPRRQSPSASPESMQLPSFLDEGFVPTEKAQPPFVGRERELAQIDEYLRAALSGSGRIAFVTGEAGRGKSTLLAEFSRRAQDHYPNLIVAAGRCNAFFGSGDPFHPFREILGLLCGDLESPLQAREITPGQAKRLWELVPSTAQALITEGKSLLEFFVSGQDLLGRTRYFSRQDPERFARLGKLIDKGGPRHIEKDELLSEFSAVLGALAKEHALLLILDDLQWVDRSSLDLLFHMSRRLHAQRIFILGAYRPSEVAITHPSNQESNTVASLSALLAEFKRRFGSFEINLDQTSSESRRQFIEALIDSRPNQLDESFRDAFYQRTRGHALFTVEMLREMQARDDLFRDENGKWRAAQELDWERLPARVEAVISQRIYRIDKELRQLLEAASVEGEEFSAQILSRVLDRDLRQVLQQLTRLETEHRLVRETAEIVLADLTLTRYKFNHILFQEYLYHHLSQGERRLLHRAIAAALEAVYAGQIESVIIPLAQHYKQADQSKKATTYLLAAGDRARNQNAFGEALEHYQQALRSLKEKGELEEAARTLMKIGLTYHNASFFEQARLANLDAFRLWQQAAHSRTSRRLPPTPHPLRIAAEKFSGELDPAMVKETQRALILQQLFGGLVRLGPDLELLPDLARSWEVLDQGRRYLFHLRRDAHWSDGAPVTAGDFEFAWKRVLDPAIGSPNANDLFDVKGAFSYHLGKSSSDGVGIAALDDFTLQVELDRVSPYFPNMLFDEFAKPLPRQSIEKYGSNWMQPDRLITNGPFRLVSYTPGEKLVMGKNPDYYGSFTGNVERVEIFLGLGDDRLRHLEMYQASELDVLYSFPHLPPEKQKQLREDLVGEVRSGPSLAAWMVGFVLDQPPFDDRRVRRAFAMAIDRDVLANVVQRGLVIPATGGFLTPVHAAYSEGIALPYDPDQARRLLAEAGYPDGSGLPAIKMVNGHASLSVEANLSYLQAQWRDHLGVNVVWETTWNMRDFLHRMKQDPPHLYFVRWAGKHSDPDDFLYLESSMIWEIARWRDPGYFALVDQARGLAAWSRRMDLYKQADRKLVEEAVLLPLVYDQIHFLVKPWVKRFVPSAIQRWHLSEVILEPH